MKSLIPNLMVEDVNETVAFYRHKLGFTLGNAIPSTGVHNWAEVYRNDVRIMFQRTGSLVQEIPQMEEIPIGGSLNLYIKVDNLQELHDNISPHVDVILDIHETFYGTKEFAILDCNGYILRFSEFIPRTFV